MREPTRAEFVAQVKQFIHQYHQDDLKSLLKQGAFQREFFSNPVILNYLSRATISFVMQHPDLGEGSPESDPACNDHYELKIYQALPEAFTYRKNVLTPEFYLSGTDARSTHHAEFLKACFQQQSEPTDDVVIDGPEDISWEKRALYRGMLDTTTPGKVRFRISSIYLNCHSTTLFSVIEPLSQQVLLSVLINSVKDAKNVDILAYLKERSLCESIESLSSSSEYISDFFTNISVESLDAFIKIPSSHLLSNEHGVVLTHSKGWRSVPDQLGDAQNHDDLEMCIVSQDTQSSDQLNFDLEIYYCLKAPTFFINLDLQSGKDDQNCTLYSYNVVGALANVLVDKAVANRIYDTASMLRKFRDTNPSSIETDKQFETMVHQFKEDILSHLKSRLPCYFDEQLNPKSREELQRFHLQQRWNFGGKSLLFYMAKNNIPQPVESCSDAPDNQDPLGEHISKQHMIKSLLKQETQQDKPGSPSPK